MSAGSACHQGTLRSGSIIAVRLSTISASSVDLGGQLNLQSAPARYDHVASVSIGRQVLLAHEGCNKPLVLDPLAAVIHDLLDGRTTLAEIAEDLEHIFPGSGQQKRAYLVDLVLALGAGAFIDSVRLGKPPDARRIHPPIEPGSCLAKQLGLDRGAMIQVGAHGAPGFRFGSTDLDVLDEVVATLPAPFELEPLDDRWIEVVFARLTTGRRPRVQQLLGTLGDPLYATRDPEEARGALRRSVAGLATIARQPGTTWFDGPVLVTDAGLTLVHPGLRHLIVTQLRLPLERAGVSLAPTTVVRAHGGPAGIAGTIPADPLERSLERDLKVLGMVVPPGRSEPTEHAQLAAHVLHRWNDAHLALIPLVLALPFEKIPSDASVDHVVQAVVGVAHGRAVA